MTSDRSGEPIRQWASGWAVLVCSLEDRITDKGQKCQGRLVTGLRTSPLTSVPLAIYEKAAGQVRPAHPPFSATLGTSMAKHAYFLFETKNQTDKAQASPATQPGPAARTPPESSVNKLARWSVCTCTSNGDTWKCQQKGRAILTSEGWCIWKKMPLLFLFLQSVIQEKEKWK